MSHESAIEDFRGAYSALFTPFTAANEVDFSALERIVHYQLQNGIRGFFVCGSTGEGLLLSFEERVEMVRQVVHLCRNFQSVAPSRLAAPTVIAHVGHPSTDVAKALAIESAAAGADWIGSIGPIFYGNTFEGALRHYRQIAEATELPFMIYALGTAINADRDRAFFEIPNVSAIKYTGADFFSVQQLARELEHPVALVSGMDEQFVAGQAMGFQAGIGSTYNFAPHYYADMHRLCQDDQFQAAAKKQAEVNRVTHLMIQYENWTYRKAIMRYIGLNCGACRAPFAPLAPREYEAFAAKLEQLDVLRPGEAVVTG